MESASYIVSRMGAAKGQVTVVGMESVPFERVLGKAIGGFMQALFEARGVAFQTLATVTKFVAAGKGGRVASVELSRAGPGGAPLPPLPATLALVGVGMIPAVDYLVGAAGVTLRAGAPGGVVADEHLRVAPGVWAAGDIVFAATRFAPHGSRIEHWDVAVDQGRLAARNMLAEGAGRAPAPYAVVPFFWTVLFGKPLRYAGHALDTSGVVVQGRMEGGAPEEARFAAFFVVGGEVAAFMSFDEGAPLAAAAVELLRLGKMPPPSAIKAGKEILDLCALLRKVQAEA